MPITAPAKLAFLVVTPFTQMTAKTMATGRNRFPVTAFIEHLGRGGFGEV